MPYFQKSGHILFGNIVNSTTFILLAWVIAFIRYKSLVEDHKNKIEIQKKSKELERINKELAVANEKASQANRVLEKISRTDSLTGIFNRSVYDNTIYIQWDRCRCDSMPISLIMIDIDYFKAFNDTYGHQAGDECLVKIAGVLSACARRSSDIVARYGGEEFAVILPNTEKHNACQVAENIR
jgi:PleD family two-component response regulator